MKFVEISKVYYDYSKYKITVSNIKKSLNEEIGAHLLKFGFRKQKENLFYNKKFDLLLEIKIKNKSKLKFV